MIENLIKLQKYFKARSIFHLVIIFIVFAISGSLTVILSIPILNFFNLNEYVQNDFIKFIIRLLLIFPLYQFILILTGLVFGEVKYFLEFEKKIIKRFFKKN